jgi:hypothetical protein
MSSRKEVRNEEAQGRGKPGMVILVPVSTVRLCREAAIQGPISEFG